MSEIVLQCLLAGADRGLQLQVSSALEPFGSLEVAVGLERLAEVAPRNPPDVVLAGPNVCASAVVAALRADPSTAHAAVVRLSETQCEALPPGALTHEADDVVSLPVTQEQLRGRLRAASKLARARRAAADAELANRRKDAFLAVLGHELRGPLSPMLTATQLLRLRGHQSHELDVLDRQLGQLSRLLDDLLDVSRITQGLTELRRHKVELAEVVARAIETAQPMLEQREQPLEVRVEPAGLGVDADPDRLAQVIANLLHNASKYSERGSPIELAATRRGERIFLSIEDEGSGIDVGMHEKIFEPFVQLPQTLSRARGGLGLGLSIVRSLVELHGGNVTAHSDGPNEGSTFVIELPAVELERPAGRIYRGPAVIASPVPPGNRRVLLVEDNEDAAETMADALQTLGYQVHVAHDGDEALGIASIFHPHVALLDLQLPVMSGYEVAERLKRLDPVRLIALTGFGQLEDRRRSLAAGFECHLTKPVDLGRLKHALETLP